MAVVDAVKERGVSRMSRVVFSLIRQMMRFAVDRDLARAILLHPFGRKKRSEKMSSVIEFFPRKRSIALKADAGIWAVRTGEKWHVWIMLSHLVSGWGLSKSKWSDLDLDTDRGGYLPECLKNGRAPYLPFLFCVETV